MRCPSCGTAGKNRVIRYSSPDDLGIRRRRECSNCGYRFNTAERIAIGIPMLVKSDGSRQSFDREKLRSGILIACAKRPVAAVDIDGLVDDIEQKLQQLGRSEIRSRVIGDLVIAGLKELDPIAYIRYAIVYLGLDSLESIRKEIDDLLDSPDVEGEPIEK